MSGLVVSSTPRTDLVAWDAIHQADDREQKRQRRKESNRESARRSRYAPPPTCMHGSPTVVRPPCTHWFWLASQLKMACLHDRLRKQAECEHLAETVNYMNDALKRAEAENDRLKDENKELRAELKELEAKLGVQPIAA